MPPEKKLYSIIDFGLKDFLRDENGAPFYIEALYVEEVETWLLNNQADHDWTNQGVRFWCWDNEE